MFTYNPDNKVLQALSKYFDMVWLTILWLLTSLPLVTLGVSTAALATVMMSLSSDTAQSGITRAFFGVWKREWRQSLPAGLAVLALAALTAADAWICLAAAPCGGLGVLLWSGTILLGICTVCTWLHLFPLLARFRVGWRQILRNLLVLTIQHPIRTLELFLLWGGALLIIYLLGFMGPLFSAPLIYMAARICTRVFNSYAEKTQCLC